MAPLYLFYNGPASNAFNSARFSFYGVTGTPTVKFDGQGYSWSPSTFPSSIADRLAEPSYLEIYPEIMGDASGGTGNFAFVAEQDLKPSGSLKAYAVIIEDHEIASSSWGGYNGQEMMWIPVAFPLGAGGTAISFSGSYPDTAYVEGSYTLDPKVDIFDNLRLVTWVQETSGSKEVMNAQYMDLPDTWSGIYESHSEDIQLTLASNPSVGIIGIQTVLPDGVSGSVSVYDMQGRLVHTLPAGEQVVADVEEPGVYFVRLSTSTGAAITRQCTVLK